MTRVLRIHYICPRCGFDDLDEIIRAGDPQHLADDATYSLTCTPCLTRGLVHRPREIVVGAGHRDGNQNRVFGSRTEAPAS